MTKLNYIAIFLLFGIFGFNAMAQTPRVIQSKPAAKTTPELKETNLSKDINYEEEEEEIDDEELDAETVVPDEFTSSLDYLLHNWAVDKNEPSDCKPRPNPLTSDEVYKERLKKLPHVIEMPYNSAVKSFIEIYTQQRRKQVEYLLGLSDYYFPIFEAALEKENLPLELKYLPIIESALNPRAVSRVGATGIWQFMIATGKMYGLEVTSLVDERMDPVKSSLVAAKFLKELYSIYSDWHLAIAAYNCGPGNVNKAIRRADGKRDFWSIYPYLPSETRSYVPIFIAANYVMSYSDEHYICPAKVRIPVLTDTIMLNKRVHLEQISAVLNVPIDELRLLNPQYRRDIIPGDIKPYPLCLPHNLANHFIDKQEDIMLYKAATLVDNRRDEVEVAQVTRTQAPKSKTSTRTKFTYHTVKKGQNLGSIAKRYKTTVGKIQRANGMRSTKIRAGQRLKIPK